MWLMVLQSPWRSSGQHHIASCTSIVGLRSPNYTRRCAPRGHPVMSKIGAELGCLFYQQIRQLISNTRGTPRNGALISTFERCEKVWTNYVHHKPLPLMTSAGGRSPKMRWTMSCQLDSWRPPVNTARPSMGSRVSKATSSSVMVASPRGRWKVCVSWRHLSTSAVIIARSTLQYAMRWKSYNLVRLRYEMILSSITHGTESGCLVPNVSVSDTYENRHLNKLLVCYH